jgi:hypothetical protein
MATKRSESESPMKTTGAAVAQNKEASTIQFGEASQNIQHLGIEQGNTWSLLDELEKQLSLVLESPSETDSDKGVAAGHRTKLGAQTYEVLTTQFNITSRLQDILSRLSI